MNPIKRFRAWCAKPYVDAVGNALAVQYAARFQIELNQQLAVAYQQGFAQGERTGYSLAGAQMQRYIDERHGLEIEQADLDRMRLVH